eukprot:UN21864
MSSESVSVCVRCGAFSISHYHDCTFVLIG